MAPKTLALRLLVLAIVTLLCYAPALRAGFVWDDHTDIEHGQLIGSLRNVPTLFLHNTMYNTDGGKFAKETTLDTYRPLAMTSFFVEHALWGKRPFGFHLGSVLLHLANVLLLYALGLVLLRREVAALTAALLFAVHPAISEAVYWINGRADPLCVGLFLGALLLWLRWLPLAPPAPAPTAVDAPAHGPAAAVGVALLFLLATLSKETAFLLLPPLVFLWPRVRRSGRGFFVAAAPWVAGAAVGLSLRLYALHGLAVRHKPAELGRALAHVPVLWCNGLRSLLLPAAELQPSLHEYFQHVPPWRPLLGVALVGALVVAAWRSRQPLVRWALATFLLTLAPVGLLTVMPGWSGWGRYLYPSAPALGLLCGLLLFDVLAPRLDSHRRWLAPAAAVALGLLCAAQTFLAGAAWQDDRAFAHAMITDHPEISTGYAALTVIELRAGDMPVAWEAISQAVKLQPDNAHYWGRASSVLLRLGRRAEALAAARHALTLAPDDNHARYVTAMLLLQDGEQEEGAQALLAVLAQDPAYPLAWELLRQAQRSFGGDSPFARAVAAALREPRYAAVAAAASHQGAALR